MPTFSPTRIWARVDKTSSPIGCWLWMGRIGHGGYGHQKATHLREGLAHRVIYRMVKGDIPEGMELDHLCRVRRCVNPDHLEPVDHRTNSLRGIGATAMHAHQTHCKAGHPFDEANTQQTKTKYGPARACRACNRAAAARYRIRQAVA